MTLLSLDFSYAYGKPIESGLFRQYPSDFKVNEIMDIDFTNEGEHFWLNIIKTSENTQWIADKLAEYFDVKKMDVGYAGKKDRHAVAQQWFSIYLPGRPHIIDWQRFLENFGVSAQLIEQKSHARKLKIGMHSGNKFSIILRGLEETEALVNRFQLISNFGVPNYFGEQRFGVNGKNLLKVQDWLNNTTKPVRNKNLRGLIISSARSYVFNCILSERVHGQTWRVLLSGDPDLHEATGTLWGRGRNLSQHQTRAVEDRVISDAEALTSMCDKLEQVGLKQERRLLNMRPKGFSWKFDGHCLHVDMQLQRGQYATSVLREMCGLYTEKLA